MVFAYIGPETALPIASTAAAAVGVVMMFGRTALRVLKRWAFKGAQRVYAAPVIAAGRRWPRGL